jgi:hypothetical protein
VREPKALQELELRVQPALKAQKVIKVQPALRVRREPEYKALPEPVLKVQQALERRA